MKLTKNQIIIFIISFLIGFGACYFFYSSKAPVAVDNGLKPVDNASNKVTVEVVQPEEATEEVTDEITDEATEEMTEEAVTE